MFEKLKDLSRVVLVPAIALYTLGFICITGYLARFGIVNFDIINARYLAAGFFPILGFGAAAALAFYLANKLSKQDLLGDEAIRTGPVRFVFYAEFAFLTTFVASLISALLSLGKVEPTPDVHSVTFNGVGGYDPVGILLAKVPIDMLPEDLSFIIRATAEIVVYGAVATGLIAAGYFTVQRIKRLKAQAGASTAIPAPEIAAAVSSSQTTKRPIKRYEWLMIRSVDGVWVAVALAVFIWSAYKLRVETIDFSLLQNSEGLSFGIVYAWFYGSVVACLFAITWIRNRAKQFSLKLFYDDPNNLGGVVQSLILPLALSLFAFGATVFPHIPFAIGGGEPREVIIALKPASEIFRGHALYLIGESSQFFFVIDAAKGGGAFQINKDEIEYIETRQMPSTSNMPQSEPPKPQPKSEPGT